MIGLHSCADTSVLLSLLLIPLPPAFPYCFLPLSFRHVPISHLEGKNPQNPWLHPPSIYCVPLLFFLRDSGRMDLHLLAPVPYFWFKTSTHCDLTISLNLCSNITTVLFQQTLLDSCHSLSSLTSLQHLTTSTTCLIYLLHLWPLLFRQFWVYSLSLFIPYMLTPHKGSTDHMELCFLCSERTSKSSQLPLVAETELVNRKEPPIKYHIPN